MVLQQDRNFLASIPELDEAAFLKQLTSTWQQGEHVLLCGPTGTGKTTTADILLDCRRWVAVLAIKKEDDTLDRFSAKERHGRDHYHIIKSWPPAYHQHKVILWVKPKALVGDTKRQADEIHKALNAMYKSGGWTIYADDAGFLTGELGLGRAIGVLLNLGRSGHLTMVVGMQRPTSVIARVPKEALSQPRHKLFYKYTNVDEMKVLANLSGISHRDMVQLMQGLEYHTAPSGNRFSDFLYVGEDKLFIVRTQVR
jgi:DNA polymerase III delta prime subunit